MRKRNVVVAISLGVFLVIFFSLLSLRTSPRASASLSHRDEKKVVKHKNDFAKKEEEGKKADRPDLFADFHRGIRTRAGEAGPTYPMNYQITELIKARGVTSTQQLSKASSAPLPWIERGPGNVAGRTRSLIVDPAAPTFNTWIVGSVGGGIWKTTDAGQNWQELTKGLTNLATSTLAMAASNPNVIYAGTGEGFGNVDQISGNGVWKSSDRGQTWQQLSSTVNNDFRHVTRVIVDPQNENIVLVATAGDGRGYGSNGIYRSTNGGQTWTKVYAATARVQQIIANPQNFKTQYATVNGTGVIKSVDGGATWNPSSTGILGVGRVELAIAPSDTSRLFISAESDQAKLYISENAGVTWALAQPLDTNTIDVLGGQGWYDNTIAVHPYDKSIVFVGGVDIWKFETRAGPSTERTVIESSFINTQSFLSFVNTGGQLGGGGIVYGNVAATDQPSIVIRFGPGKKQKAHRFLVPEGSTSGVPAANYSYQDYVDVPFEVWDIGTNPNRQLMVSFRDQTRNGQFELEEFEDTRTREYIFPQLETYNATTPSPNIAKAGGHTYKQLYLIWPILTTGATWTPNNLPDALIRIRWGNLTTQNVARSVFLDGYSRFGGSSKGVHVDHHNIVLVPTNPAQQQFRIINANDGGLSYSDDGGQIFLQTGDTFLGGGLGTRLKGYNTSQFYGLDKMNGADRYIGGTQDNGTWLSPVNTDKTSSWDHSIDGDGFETAWNYKDPNKIIGTVYNNRVRRSLDGGQTWADISPPQNDGPFITRVAKSKQDADLIFLTGLNGIWRSENFGTDWALTQMPTGFSGGSTFAQVKISLASPQVVWAGHAMTTSLAPFVSTDGGSTFTKTTVFGPSLGSLTGMTTHPTDEKTAYALFSIARAPKILRTTDLGQTWTDISGFGSNPTSSNGFPDVATFSLLVMPYNTNILWAGTEIGIFESTDGGNTWKYADNGLPPVSIWDMTIVNDEVAVATHGRGIWSVSLPELAGYEPPAVVLSPRFREVGGGLNGFISASINLASAYDSSFVMLDGAKYLKLGANAAPKDTALVVIVPITSLRNVTVSLLAYRDGQSYKSIAPQLQLLPLKTAQVKYSNNFNNLAQANGDFALNGFSFDEVPIGFTNSAMHSLHPYDINRNYLAYLLTPIRVAPGNAILKYDDIAIIEPGEDGSVFGDDDFYDYVVVEGSADFGKTWTPLAPGYDARDDTRWLTAYNSGLSGAPDMFKSHQIDLRQTFKAGDQIVIRFRLFSDPGAVGWGWTVDNLVIQENATSVAEETSSLPMTYHLEQNYPNPFNPSTRIKYALPQNAAVKLVVYNSFGQQVRMLLDAKIEAGFHEIEWDGRNDAGTLVATGVYFYKLVTSDYVRTLKMLFVK